MDKTYTFTRGIDTVHVTVPQREIGRARFKVWATTIAIALFSMPLCILLPFFLVIPIGAGFYLVGRLNLMKEDLHNKAEAQANRQFDHIESERWRATRALRP